MKKTELPSNEFMIVGTGSKLLGLMLLMLPYVAIEEQKKVMTASGGLDASELLQILCNRALEQAVKEFDLVKKSKEKDIK